LNAKKISVCYLCGKELVEPINRDHVPLKQFYTEEIRKMHSPNLLTIPVHTACNSSYQLDEDYFINTLVPFAKGSYSGDSSLKDVFKKYSDGVKRSLVHKTLNEFERNPSGLILPPGLVAKRFESERFHRIAWKIVRGLYFHHFNKFLPEKTPNSLSIIPPDQVPPEAFLVALGDLDGQGGYPGVFDYKFIQIPELQDFNYWGMLLWDRIILIVAFHGLNCSCTQCLETKAPDL
jgi:hypothetical protein